MTIMETSLDPVFSATGNAIRRPIIHRLAAGTASISELVQAFNMALAAFLKQIAVRENRGLISSSKEARVRTCQLNTREFSHAENRLCQKRA